MPIFEYKCRDCGRITEKLVKNASSKAPPCRFCGSDGMEKQFSGFSAQVKQSALPPKTGCPGCPNSSCPMAGK